MHTDKHIPVLLQPVLNALAVRPSGTYFDGTLGGGGHAAAILAQLSREGTYVGVDKDEQVLQHTARALSQQFAHGPRLVFRSAGFEDIAHVCAQEHIRALDGVLLDLGWGSHTLLSGRGFSFQKDEPLLMTYTVPTSETLTALDIVNTWSEETLTAIFQGWGEERRARRAAQAIVTAREDRPIRTTSELIAVLEHVLPKVSKMHPATRIFQALRIAVNRELEILVPACESARALLRPHGRLCVITFHSGEDRIIKQLFNAWAEKGYGIHHTKKVVVPSAEEKIINPRARSAKLRVFEAEASL